MTARRTKSSQFTWGSGWGAGRQRSRAAGGWPAGSAPDCPHGHVPHQYATETQSKNSGECEESSLTRGNVRRQFRGPRGYVHGDDEQASGVRRSSVTVHRSESVSYEDPLAPAVTLDLPLRALIPEEYVAERPLRLRLYRRIAGVTDTAALDALAEELVDRFGPLPVEVQNLLYQVRIKLLALTAGVTAIGHDNGQLVLKSDDLEQVDRQRLQARIGDDARVARRAIWLPIADGWPEALERTLRALRAAHM